MKNLVLVESPAEVKITKTNPNTKDLKIVIAAGGDGTRINKITNGDPKPFLYFNDKPLIGHQLEILESLGFRDIFLSFNKKEQIQKFIQFVKNKKVPQNINYSFGIHSAFDHPGKLFLNKKVKNYIKNSDFLSSYGDLVFDKKLIKKIYDAYKKHNCFVTNIDRPRETDKIEFIRKDNIVVEEKNVGVGNATWRYGGLFLVPKDYHQIWLETFLPGDQSLIPFFFTKCLVNNKKIFVVEYEGTFINVNTPKDYQLAQKYFHSKG